MTHQIDVLDYDREAGLTGRRPFVTVPEADGLPDGLTVERDGGERVALYGGSAVRRSGGDGALEEVLDLPGTQVTACTFGGPDLDDLYITTSRETVPDGDQPQAGSLFVARPGTGGRPVVPFAG